MTHGVFPALTPNKATLGRSYLRTLSQFPFVQIRANSQVTIAMNKYWSATVDKPPRQTQRAIGDRMGWWGGG